MEDNRTPEAVLFDLDDTILMYTAGTQDLWKDLCNRFAVEIGTVSGNDLFQAIQSYSHWYWSDADRHSAGRLDLWNTRRENIRHVFETEGINRPDLAVNLADAYNTERTELIQVFTGAHETLERLKLSGVKMALITNGASEPQRAKIERFNLSHYFDCITIEGEYGRGKPDKAVFDHTLEVLGVEPSDAWMIGDDLNRDIVGAKEAGICGVWVDWESKGLPDGHPVQPDLIIRTLSEIIYNELLQI